MLDSEHINSNSATSLNAISYPIRPVADNPIFILGPHKSGTSLLRSLFDGHPELFVIPTECHFFWHANNWIEYPYRRSKPPLREGDELRNAFYAWIEKSNSHTDRYGDMVTNGRWDLERLKIILFEDRKVGESTREEIDRFVNAMWYALKQDQYSKGHKPIRFVEKSVENAELAPVIKKIYPGASFLHIVRNPYANLVSFRKYKTKRGKYPFIIPLLKSLYLSFYHLYRNREVLPNYHIVEYEKLVSQPLDTVKTICRLCDFTFDECLLEPMLLGKPWDGNSMYNEKFQDVSAKSLNRWKAEIFDFEIDSINKSLGIILDEYGYERMLPKKGTVWPMKNESVKTYFKNRYFMKYSKNIFQ